MSGGQQQRVALARALIRRPDVLLLDEPLANLDARLRLDMRGEIRRIQRETHTTAILVTHDQVEAMSMCDRIAILEKGEVIQVATPSQMYARPANRFVASFLGSPPIAYLDARAETQGMRLASVDVLVPWPVGVKPVEPGSPISVGVRPEAFGPPFRCACPGGSPPSRAMVARCSTPSISPTAAACAPSARSRPGRSRRARRMGHRSDEAPGLRSERRVSVKASIEAFIRRYGGRRTPRSGRSRSAIAVPAPTHMRTPSRPSAPRRASAPICGSSTPGFHATASSSYRMTTR
jgi:ABC-type sugar transport systems, ATPase components